MHFLGLKLVSFYLSCTAAQSLVRTQQGDVLGTQVTPTVRQFLGIPYAVAGRWEAPKLPARRSRVFRANQFGDSCIQTNSPSGLEFLRLTGSVIPNVTESESCLSVNIWVPSTNRKQKTAVMVWIYGGGFLFGTVCLSRSSRTSPFPGSNLTLDLRATFRLMMVVLSFGIMTMSLL